MKTIKSHTGELQITYYNNNNKNKIQSFLSTLSFKPENLPKPKIIHKRPKNTQIK